MSRRLRLLTNRRQVRRLDGVAVVVSDLEPGAWVDDADDRQLARVNVVPAHAPTPPNTLSQNLGQQRGWWPVLACLPGHELLALGRGLIPLPEHELGPDEAVDGLVAPHVPVERVAAEVVVVLDVHQHPLLRLWP